MASVSNANEQLAPISAVVGTDNRREQGRTSTVCAQTKILASKSIYKAGKGEEMVHEKTKTLSDTEQRTASSTNLVPPQTRAQAIEIECVQWISAYDNAVIVIEPMPPLSPASAIVSLRGDYPNVVVDIPFAYP
ncbi:hypothetical protein BDN71DRAFT_1433591 [Pleurotus eryngii]|uniref:Uncharacterized protein n=1 Tax=Pleurotus eryngii TaxID=5323 RepID=A0A9P5ZTD0_PLEER|nr:hypothetical protein BDN71DRAFT_1433591 [Pleurotus eryngii]